MAAEKSPAFQFYARDWLSSDSVSLMTAEQAGAYITLLAHAWLKPEGLPADVPSLAKLARVPASRFERSVWPRVSGCFRTNDGGNLYNARLETERDAQETHRAERSQSGKRGAATRWALKLNSSANGSAIKEPMAKNSSSSATASASASTAFQAVEPPPPPRLNGARNPDRMTYGPIVLWASWFRDDIVPLVATHHDGDRDAAYAPALAWVGEVDARNATMAPGRDVLAKPREWWRVQAAEKWGSESCQTTPVTERERRNAEEVRRKAFGRCPHDPPCGSYAACVTMIALEQRADPMKARA